ncbi:IS66 family insertion sequence element accessory protein TnpB [Myxococcota bacterium]
MLSLAPTVSLYVCTSPVDMRRSWNGLANATRELIGGNPVSGELFVFFNRSRNICKTLWWSSGGFCLFGKRLARGKFRVPDEPAFGTQHVEMGAAELALILEGIDLVATKKRLRWNPAKGKVRQPSNSDARKDPI